MIVNKIVNVHLRGKLRQGKWVLDHPGFDFYEVLKRIRNNWGYEGLLTMEPDGTVEGSFDRSRFHSFIEAMKTLRAA
jgi:hypothetical protein